MLYIGIDLGGTNIGAGLVNEEGEILRQASLPTLVERGAEAIARDMGKLSLQLINEHGINVSDVAAIGVGVPGISDAEGNVLFCTNLGWKDVPLSKIIREIVDLPVIVDNDATVAGLAEAVAGVSRGYKNSLFITLGTGVGGGLFVDGKVYVGSHRAAGEVGHMCIELDGEQCSCGSKGCWERYSSATALIRMANDAIKDTPDSLMVKKCEGDLSRLDARIIIDSAREKDAAAIKVYEKYIYYLAIGLTSIIHIFDPDIIALGGGVSNAGDFLVQPLREEIQKHFLFKNIPHADIKIATLRNDAGIIGAAMLGR